MNLLNEGDKSIDTNSMLKKFWICLNISNKDTTPQLDRVA